MPRYRLIFTEPQDSPPEPISFVGRDAGEALLLAQRHKGPVELWQDNKRLCTLRQSGDKGEKGQFWIISGAEPSASAETA
jgi:hypothetical protein